MDQNKPKSKIKTFIITFIVVLLLLFLFYLSFSGSKSKTANTNVQGSSSSSFRDFFRSLFNKKSPTALNVVSGKNNTGGLGGPSNPSSGGGNISINNAGGSGPISGNGPGSSGTGPSAGGGVGGTGGTGPNTGAGPNTGGAGQNTGTGPNTGGGLGAGGTGIGLGGSGFGVTPGLNPLPTPGTIGSGPSGGANPGDSGRPPTVDNGPGGVGGGGEGGGLSPTVGSGLGVTESPVINCPDLVFTKEEQAKLDDLLRQYYLLAPNLKTEDDIALIQTTLLDNQNTINQAKDLTKQCVDQKASPAYTGPQAVKDNPFFSGGSANPYLPNFSEFENLFGIW